MSTTETFNIIAKVNLDTDLTVDIVHFEFKKHKNNITIEKSGRNRFTLEQIQATKQRIKNSNLEHEPVQKETLKTLDEASEALISIYDGTSTQKNTNEQLMRLAKNFYNSQLSGKTIEDHLTHEHSSTLHTKIKALLDIK